jgi:hypothetical protein
VKEAISKNLPTWFPSLRTIGTFESSRKDLTKSSTPGDFSVSFTVATNQVEHSEPKITTPEKDLLYSSKRSSEIPNFAKKKKSLASTTNLRSMIGLNCQASKNCIMKDEPRKNGEKASQAIRRKKGR